MRQLIVVVSSFAELNAKIAEFKEKDPHGCAPDELIMSAKSLEVLKKEAEAHGWEEDSKSRNNPKFKSIPILVLDPFN